MCATVDDISCCVLLLKWNFIYVDSSKLCMHSVCTFFCTYVLPMYCLAVSLDGLIIISVGNGKKEVAVP